jgi:hypothetical protein
LQRYRLLPTPNKETIAMTTAQQIAEQFGNDGQKWADERGNGLEVVCADHGATAEWQHGDLCGSVRYTFPDGSIITVAGDGWDLGYAGCFCWQGAGHQDSCPYAHVGEVSLDNGTTWETPADLDADDINEHWHAIVDVMDSDTREQVHGELAPCSEAAFLSRYAELAKSGLCVG